MRRRRFLLLAASAAAAWPRGNGAAAGGPDRRPVIGVLLYNSRRQFSGPDHPLILGLREVGLIDGETATMLVREAEGHSERLPQFAAELVAARPDILVSGGPQPIAALRSETAT